MPARLPYTQQPSPNHSPWTDPKLPSALVIHYTAGATAAGAINWLCSPESKASAHFVIAKNGLITQLVDLDHQAWHAGQSQLVVDGKIRKGCNAFTLGIELDNRGLVGQTPAPNLLHARLIYDTGRVVEGWWDEYPETQIMALKALLNALSIAGYSQAVSDLVGHEEIAPDRKMDPGPAFPWDRFTRTRARMTKREVL